MAANPITTARPGFVLQSTHPGFLDGAIDTKMDRGVGDPRQINGIDGFCFCSLFYFALYRLPVLERALVVERAYCVPVRSSNNFLLPL
jgi:hypothetical protein